MLNHTEILASRTSKQLLNYIRSGYPIYFLRTTEEERCCRLLSALAKEWFRETEYRFAEWNITEGWRGLSANDGLNPDKTKSPLAALNLIQQTQANGFFLLKDFLPFFEKPDSVRSVRNFYQCNSKKPNRFIFMISPAGIVPEELSQDTVSMDLPGPDAIEIQSIVEDFLQGLEGTYNKRDLGAKLCLSLRGLKEPAILHLFSRIKRSALSQEEVVREIYSEKERQVREEGFLEFVPPKVTPEDLGGLDNFKVWLDERTLLFRDEQYSQKARAPKGVLIMGISGCGKSLAVKSISDAWNLPLFRLRMGNIFSGPGSPEQRFGRCLRLAEELAPVVIWIDEIEKSLSSDEMVAGSQVASNSRIFSEFLTWMEEKPSMVFVAATANRVKSLPAELIRKGRFDQVFFVDLPNPVELQEIFEIHLRHVGLDSSVFDMVTLARATQGWNGSEVEEVVNSTVIETFSSGEEITTNHLLRKIEGIVPLSKTYPAQISETQRWACDAATPASRFSTFVRKKNLAKVSSL